MQQEYSYYTITNASEIIIDEEFKQILPVLGEKELASIEKSILKYGCIEPLKLWNGILLDGHNRLGVLTKHGLPVKTVSLELESREEAIIWIIDFQITRRNLNPVQLSYYRGLHYHTEKLIITNKVGVNQFTEVEEQNVPQAKRPSTADRLGDYYNVSSMTIKRDAQVTNAINFIGEKSPDIKASILSGTTHITKKQLKELSSGTQDDVSVVVNEINNGTFVSRRPGTPSTDHKTYDPTDSAVMQPWEREFSKMTDEFRSIMRGYASTEDTTSVKIALKQYIGMLEDLYKSI